jgi:hypothetical protein
VLLEARDDETGNGHRLQRDEQRDEVARARHDEHAEEARQQQEVELTLDVPDDLVEVRHRHQDQDGRNEDEKELEEHRVVVENEHPAERPARSTVDQSHEREACAPHACHRDDRVRRLRAVGQEQIDDEDGNERDRDDDLGQDRVDVYRREREGCLREHAKRRASRVRSRRRS